MDAMQLGQIDRACGSVGVLPVRLSGPLDETRPDHARAHARTHDTAL